MEGEACARTDVKIAVWASGGGCVALSRAGYSEEEEEMHGMPAPLIPALSPAKPLPESYKKALESHRRARESKERLEAAKAEYIEGNIFLRAKL